MINTQAASLHDLLIAANVPVVTVRHVGSSFEIVYADNATTQQRTQGNNILAAFDGSEAAEQARVDALHAERTTLRQQATSAVSNNLDYLAIAAPTALQVRTQTQALTQQINAIIKRLVQID